MKCIRIRQYGEPAEVLAVEERPIPEPGPGEARVRMLATPVNPSDLLYVRGVYAGVQARFPAPAGFEGVGVVDALGPGADGDLARGQRVSVVNGQGGNWADYAVVPANDLIPVADDVPDEQAASFVINPASAILMLRHVLAVPRGEWPRLGAKERQQLTDAIAGLVRDGILETAPGRRYIRSTRSAWPSPRPNRSASKERCSSPMLTGAHSGATMHPTSHISAAVTANRSNAGNWRHLTWRVLMRRAWEGRGANRLAAIPGRFIHCFALALGPCPRPGHAAAGAVPSASSLSNRPAAFSAAS